MMISDFTQSAANLGLIAHKVFKEAFGNVFEKKKKPRKIKILRICGGSEVTETADFAVSVDSAVPG